MDNDHPLDTEQISSYLRAHPQFFEQHAELLAELYLPSPHGNGTISLAERQQLAQRDKIRVMEVKLAELLRMGKENDAISEKVHRLSLGLLASQNLEVLLQMMTHTLREDFKVPYVALRLWAQAQHAADADHEAFSEVIDELREQAQKLAVPYCGNAPDIGVDSWFGVDITPKSYALIALRGENVFGLLALASDDEQRFFPEMGTMFVKRIGELVSASLLRYID